MLKKIGGEGEKVRKNKGGKKGKKGKGEKKVQAVTDPYTQRCILQTIH